MKRDQKYCLTLYVLNWLYRGGWLGWAVDLGWESMHWVVATWQAAAALDTSNRKAD